MSDPTSVTVLSLVQKAAGLGRECPEPDCITILCAYNPGPKCYRHTRRRRRRSSAGERHLQAAA